MSSSDSAAPSLASTDAGSSLSSSSAAPSSSVTGASASTAIVPAGGAAQSHQQAQQAAQQGGPPGSSLDEQIERLKRCEYLRENEVKALCLRAREILVDEGNVQRVDAPVTVSVSSLGLVWSWESKH